MVKCIPILLFWFIYIYLYNDKCIVIYRMKKIVVFLFIVLSFGSMMANPPMIDSDLNLIPQPRRVDLLSRRKFVPQQEEVTIRMDAPAEWNEERYSLSVTPERIEIIARTERGVIWARNTLRQLRRKDGTYPHVRIEDWPEFPIRGFLHDDGRNFVGVERIKNFLDLMSAYKLNLFQWHLTDKPAWRIECRCYPQLNNGKFQRPGRDQGCFYTYSQIREVIEYAKKRGIMVLPEIDMPGHSDFFQTTFGFSMDSQQGREVLEKCLKEFFEEIPVELCPVVHIGSDEVHIREPKGFMKWAQETVRNSGRSIFAWDPGLPADSLTVRQFWRGGSPEKVSYPQGLPFVDSSMGYLNIFDPLLMPAKIFFHTPCGTGKANESALGGIVCLWNDVRVADKDVLMSHNGIAGGMMAFAERFWCGGTTSDEWLGTLLPAPDSEAMRRFEQFQQRMTHHKLRFLPEDLSYWEPIHASQWQVELQADTMRRSFIAWGDVLDLNELCRLHGISDKFSVNCTITRKLFSTGKRTGYFKIGFEAPARSNRCSDGIAEQGSWPNGGRIEVNGVLVNPPIWLEPGYYRYHYPTWARLEEELPYTDEQLYWMRSPVAVPLNAGENIVKISLRRHFPGQVFHAAFVECDK